MRGMRLILFGLALALLAACSVQKRVHRTGYHIAWPGKSAKVQTAATGKPAAKKPELPVVASRTIPVSAKAIAALAYRPAPVFTGSRTYIDNCDTIVLRNEAEIRARVYLVTDTEIKYKFCNNTAGPMLVVSKDDVAMIKYASGLQETFTRAKTDVIDAIVERTIHKAAQTSMWTGISAYAVTLLPIVGVIVGIVLAIIAITSGSRALRLIDDNDRLDVLYGRRARTGSVLGIVYLCLILFVALLAVLFILLYI